MSANLKQILVWHVGLLNCLKNICGLEFDICNFKFPSQRICILIYAPPAAVKRSSVSGWTRAAYRLVGLFSICNTCYSTRVFVFKRGLWKSNIICGPSSNCPTSCLCLHVHQAKQLAPSWHAVTPHIRSEVTGVHSSRLFSQLTLNLKALLSLTRRAERDRQVVLLWSFSTSFFEQCFQTEFKYLYIFLGDYYAASLVAVFSQST